jgi:hypothetical protein
MPAPIDSTTLEAERRLIASAFVDDHWLAAARRDLRPDHFAEPKHQTLWQAILDTTGEHATDTADEISITAWLTQHKRLEQITAADLSGITSLVLFPTPATHRWQEHVITSHKTREIARAAALLVSKAESGAFTIDELGQEANRIAALSTPERKKGDTGPHRFDWGDLLTFDRADDPTAVLGNRWLCRGGSCLLVAQTGAGKSALTTQAAMTWALGRDFFGITSKRGPLRSLVIQSENDLGDVAESVQGTLAGLEIGSSSQLAQDIGSKVAYYREAVRTGEDFGKLLRELVLAHKADLVFVDPLLGFAGIDIADQEQASHFLRHIIQPVLTETGVILFSIHHTTKPKPKAEQTGATSGDLSYLGAGSAELANWHRAVMVLQKDTPTEGEQEQPHFTLRLAKRGGRAGLKDAQGDFTTTIPLRHAREPGVIRWERRYDPASSANPSPIEQKATSRAFVPNGGYPAPL